MKVVWIVGIILAVGLCNTHRRSSLFAVANEEKCVPCDGDFDPFAMIEGITCEVWNRVTALGPVDDKCYKQRLLGYYYCGCPSPTNLVCGCSQGAQMAGTGLVIENSLVTCRDASRLPAIDGEESCRVIEKSCCQGGSTLDGTCTLCQVRGNMPSNMTLPIIGRLDGYTCGQMAGRPILGDTDCHKKAFNTTIDEAAYCGCPRIDPPNICQICPRGQEVVHLDTAIPETELSDTLFAGKTGITCRDLLDIQPYVVDNSVCRKLKFKAIAYCCGISEKSTLIPPDKSDTGNAAVVKPSSSSSSSATTQLHTTQADNLRFFSVLFASIAFANILQS